MRRDHRDLLMPILTRGSHIHPRVGACFAEVAATLGTHTWSSHPDCLPPVLLRLAWGVNDRTSPPARTALAPLIPWAIRPPDRPDDRAADIAVISVLTGPDRDEADGADLRRSVQRLAHPPRPHHIVEQAAWRRASRRLVRIRLASLTATAEGPVRDARLRALLIAAVDATRAADGLPPLPEPVTGPTSGVHLLPVTAHLTRIDEVPELHVEPLLDDWPDWLRDPWTQRRSEMTAAIPGPRLGARSSGTGTRRRDRAFLVSRG